MTRGSSTIRQASKADLSPPLPSPALFAPSAPLERERKRAKKNKVRNRGSRTLPFQQLASSVPLFPGERLRPWGSAGPFRGIKGATATRASGLESRIDDSLWRSMLPSHQPNVPVAKEITQRMQKMKMNTMVMSSVFINNPSLRWMETLSYQGWNPCGGASASPPGKAGRDGSPHQVVS